jgi:hypothetical protein
MSPTLATAAMKRISRRHTQNTRRASHRSTQPYRSNIRLKGYAIADAAEKHWQYFQIDATVNGNDEHFKFLIILLLLALQKYIIYLRNILALIIITFRSSPGRGTRSSLGRSACLCGGAVTPSHAITHDHTSIRNCHF